MKKLYQFCIEKWIFEDWSGTIYRSRLYPSKEACLTGCAEEEILDIAETVLQQSTEQDNLPDIDPDDFLELYKNGDTNAVCIVNRVKEWLHDPEGDSFCMNNTCSPDEMFWNLLELNVVEEENNDRPA
jgi:hypothetical protein